ncbi:MAG: hypothetical protein ACPL7D_10350 [Candidatus Sumerlaeaceae bacterium]|jgi:hypothetical protein
MPKGRKPFEEDEEPNDLDETRNVCMDCVYWDVDPDDASEEAIAPCIHPDLEEYELMVSGDSSCNLFEPRDEDDEDYTDEAEEDEY